MSLYSGNTQIKGLRTGVGSASGGITGILMNNNTVTITNGVADLGTVITDVSGKQDTLVGSGTGQNIKTINNTSILGTGDISVQATLVGSGTGQNIKTINSTSLLGSGNIAVQATLVGSGTGQNIKTINNNNILGSGNISIPALPTVSSSDNGKILEVSNGAWAAVKPVTIYSGTTAPSSGTGSDGDIYIQTTT